MFMGVIRGLGLQPKVSFVPLTGYWILGIPLAAVLVNFFEWQLEGVYLGMLIAIAFNFFMYGYIVTRCDWQKQADIAQERKRKDQEKIN